MQWNRDNIILGLLLPLLLFLGFNRHSKHENFNYHGELWADKAGYHVYLPALFYYDFQATKFPEKINKKTGNGFELHLNTNKVKTKYPMGVAVLHSPFFAIGALMDAFKSETIKGYSTVQHKMILVSSAFYVWLGLVLLFLMIRRQFGAGTGYLLLLLALVATNLLFYTTRDAGLSHAYSFAVVAGLLYSLEDYVSRRRPIALIVAVFLASLGCLIRPSNILLYSLLVLVYTAMHWHIVVEERHKIWKALGLGVVIGLIFPVLQLFYYNYAHGSYFAYAYSDESFIYALKPRLARVWFAPANGLFLYSPLFALALFFAIKQLKRRDVHAISFAMAFVGMTYLYASWWTPGLGCGYGHRGFVELIPLLMLPLASGLSNVSTKLRGAIVGLFCVYGALLMHFQYLYDGCWYGNGYWDWNEILLILGW